MYLINSIFINLYPIYQKISQLFTDNLIAIGALILGLLTIGLITNIIHNLLGD